MPANVNQAGDVEQGVGTAVRVGDRLGSLDASAAVSDVHLPATPDTAVRIVIGEGSVLFREALAQRLADAGHDVVSCPPQSPQEIRSGSIASQRPPPVSVQVKGLNRLVSTVFNRAGMVLDLLAVHRKRLSTRVWRRSSAPHLRGFGRYPDFHAMPTVSGAKVRAPRPGE